MIEKSLLIRIILLVCTIKNFNTHEYSRRAERSTSKSTPFDISKIERFDPELCIDLGLFVSQTIITESSKHNLDPTEFIDNVILETKKIFLWHNITLRISEFEIFTSDPFPHTNRNDEDVDFLKKLLQERKSKNDVNIYIKDYINPSWHQKEGYANMNTVCTENAVGTLNIYRETDEFNPKTTASYIANLIGQQLGFNHSRSSQPGCECGFPNVFCLGSPKKLCSPNSDIPMNFENCLINDLKRSISSYSCLQSCHKIKEKSYCGDGIVNGDEKCDCGFEELCKLHGKHKCCDPKTCQFKQSDFQCDEGDCCEGCKFKKYDVCRKESNGKKTNSVCTGLYNKCVPATETIINRTPDQSIYDRDKLCVKNFGEGNFFSERCYQNIERYINYHCDLTVPGSEFYNGDCIDRSSICKNLVCEGPAIELTNEIYSVNYISYFCNYYKSSHKRKKFGAHDWISCSPSNNKVCSKGECRFLNNVKSKLSAARGSSQNVISSEFPN